MKRNIVYLLLLVLIAGFFLYFARSIVEITMVQLRMDITRRQLLNYELASNILDSRFDNLKGETSDFDGEVRMSVLESSVLNSDLEQPPIQMGPYEYTGLFAVNSIRLLNLKGMLSLEDDAERLLMLQYAFFMQRKKRYDRAINAYDKLQTEVGIDKDEDRAFVLLHSGYSYALAGKIEDAVSRLGFVRNEFAGTHFADSAGDLLDVLLNVGRRAMRDAENPNLSRSDRAHAYFRAYRFLKVIEMLENDIQNSSTESKLIYARSLEESGRIEDSTEIYKQLVQAGADENVMRRANRRLLLLGNFYSAGEDVKEFAERQAYLMGDTEAVRQINERLVYFEQPRFFERLQQDGDIELPPELIEEIRKNLKNSLPPEEVASLPAVQVPEEVAAAAETEANRSEAESGAEPGAAEPVDTAQNEEQAKQAAQPPVAAARPAPVARVPRQYVPPYNPYWQRAYTPPRPARRAPSNKNVRIVFEDGREILARAVEIEGDLMRIEQGGTSIEMDFALVEAIRGEDDETGVAMRLAGNEVVEGASMRYDGGDVSIVSADGEEQDVEAEVVRIESAHLPEAEDEQ